MYVCALGISQLSASHGLRLKWSSRRTSESKSSVSIRSDCASTPTRGSRYVGLHSMTMNRVLGSGFRAQPGRSRTRQISTAETQRHRDNLDLGLGQYPLRSCRTSWFCFLTFSSCRSPCLCVSVVNELSIFSVPSVFSVVKRNLHIATFAKNRGTLGS